MNSKTLGIWQILNSEIITDIIGSANFDFVIFDLEHGLHDALTVQKCLYAAKSKGIESFARVPSLNFLEVVKLVDTGIDGVIIPHIESKKDLNLIKKHYLTPSLGGDRSISPFVPRLNFGDLNKKNINPLIGILIESNEGMKNSMDLISANFVDFIYFGAYDLSIENKIPGEIYHKRILDKLEQLTNLCIKFEKKIMAIYRNEKELSILKDLGITNPVFSVDTLVLKKSLEIASQSFKKLKY